MVKNQNEHLENLAQIRSMMERSSRFISLSGLSGVAAGTCAILGAGLVYLYLDMPPFSSKRVYYEEAVQIHRWGLSYLTFFVLTATIVFLLALVSGIYFTTRKARKKGQKVWDAASKRMLVNLAIPLFTGGLFCIALFNYGMYGLIAPSTLIFYGLALVNGGKYTLDDIRYLGVTEIVLGIIALFNPGNGLEFWAFGFGVLHIVYGIIMYNKYEKV
ncbi:MAG: hypothetical protein H6577_19690 [Lewinellaceae bacterium]|nr:hypothetical protein [Saprospiraceae bacterium]MCB9340351.1 hypothetical protein [Lewinellaceae bacterium]